MDVRRELRKLRIEKGWRLWDIAAALGVTPATISRIERGLQEPSPALLAAWQRLFAGKQSGSEEIRRIQRRPRGVLPELARLFLADVKAGLDEVDAGWREPIEVGLIDVNLNALGSEVELDELGRVRIALTSSLEPIEEAKQILGYRAMVEAEEQSLIPFIEQRLPILWRALEGEKTAGAVLLSGLTMMVRTTVPYVLDAVASVIGPDASYLLSGAEGVARVILDAIGVSVPDSPSSVLKTASLDELVEASEKSSEAPQAGRIAHQLGLPVLASRLGKNGVIALGAAWAATRLLESEKVEILTEEGRQHLAKAFWQGIRIFQTEVRDAWQRLVETDEDVERIGALIWSWPEVL